VALYHRKLILHSSIGLSENVDCKINLVHAHHRRLLGVDITSRQSDVFGAIKQVAINQHPNVAGGPSKVVSSTRST